MLDFLDLEPEAFGLDISDLSLKIMKLRKKAEFLDMACFGEANIKPGIIEKGEIKDIKALTGIIKKSLLLVKGDKTKTKYAVASLPEEKAFLEVIQMPKMEMRDLKKAVYFEAENYVPMAIDDVYLDFQLVQPVQNGLDHLDVLIAALPKKTVDSYVECLMGAGLKVKSLEIESLAIARAVVKDNLSPVPLLLIDIGATRTGFIIFAGHSLRFTVSIPISSRTLTRAISKTLKIDLNEAEKLKFEQGLEKNKTKRSKDVFDALIPSMTDLLEQIKKYLYYYQSHVGHEHLPPNSRGVEKILLCGGGANLKGLPDFLSRELKISVILANPWVNILPSHKTQAADLSYKESLAFTTALGLALRGIKEDRD